MAATGADCLAVSVGNVHGDYRDPPALDWPRLAEIRASVRAAALAARRVGACRTTMLARAIDAGIAKVNVNTELRPAYLEATARRSTAS